MRRTSQSVLSSNGRGVGAAGRSALGKARTCKLLALCAATFFVSHSEHMFAADATWDGGGADPNFITALNWASDTVPAANDTLTFAGITRVGPNNDLAAGTAFNGITFASTAGAFTLGGNQITLHGDIS